MSSTGSAFGRSPGLLLPRLLWPMAVVFAAALWVVFSTMLWTVESLDEDAVERQGRHLAIALDRDASSLAASVASFIAGTGSKVSAGPNMAAEFWRRIGEPAPAPADMDGLVVVTADWRPVAGSLGPDRVTDEAAERLRPIFERLSYEARAGASGRRVPSPALGRPARAVLSDGRAIYAATAAALELPAAPGETFTVLAYRVLTPERLQVIAAPFDIAQVSITFDRRERHAPAAALPVPGPGGETLAHVTWTSGRPGDLLRRRAIPLTLFGLVIAAVLFGILTGHFRRLVRDLASTEVRSRDLIGRDPLSGLANRLLFAEHLDRELAQIAAGRAGLAVLFIDLDRFKDVNDTHGHQAGDDLIRLVGLRLTNLVRSTDTIARFGGDEFAIIQTGIRSAEDAAALAERVLEALTRPFVLDGTHVLVGASIGVALAPAHGLTREGLMGLADTALYQAKSRGRNRFVFFENRMDETIRMRKTVEEDLRRAIEMDELLLHYQPLFSADGEKVVGLEALVRWPHATRGLIPPGEFIPIAEERGLIIPLGEWVLRRACLDGLRWPGVRIAVNVSPIQFRHRDFVQKVTDLLAETGFEPTRLELELTEGVVVEDADAAESAMMELRALGVHLALDDFGTGYSSLIYLRRFAFDTIKIDRSFLESMEATGESAILVHSMVHLGRALGLTVTAEGVETAEQHRFLQALGCHQLQGYLFSRPLTSEQVDALIGTGPDQAAAA